MEWVAGSDPSVLSFLEFVVSLPSQIIEIWVKKPVYPQIPKRFFTKKGALQN